MKTLNEYIADNGKAKKVLLEKDEYTGATSAIGTIRNIIWKIFQNSRYKSILAKIKTNPSNHSNQVRVWFTEKTMDDVAEFEAKLNGILCPSSGGTPTPFTSIEYDPTWSGSKTYVTWILHLKPAMGQDEKNEFSECGNLDLLQGCGQMQLCYALSSKKLLKTKDLDPSAFGLTVKEESVDGKTSSPKMYDEDSLVDAVLSKIASSPAASPFGLFERYIKETIGQICGISGSKLETRNPSALQIGEIMESDLNCANKDFGEIACALSVLHSAKGMGMKVVFPEAENEKLIDFKLMSPDGMRHYYYSVKNKGKNKGTGGTILAKLWEEYVKANPWERKNMNNLGFSVLVRLMEKGGEDTREKLCKCAKYAASRMPNGTPVQLCLQKLQAELSRINGIGTVKADKNVSFKNASAVLESACRAVAERLIAKFVPKDKKKPFNGLEEYVKKEFLEDSDGKRIIEAMYSFRQATMHVGNETKDSIYSMLVPGIKIAGGKASVMYPKYGIFVYAIGANLAKSLNLQVNGQPNGFLAALNKCLCWHENYFQIETDISISRSANGAVLNVKMPKRYSFSASRFKFEYNGMSKNSGNNRPLNFIREH